MKRILLAAGLAALSCAPALAQYYGPPVRPAMPLTMDGRDVPGLVRHMGLDPVGPPQRLGNVYVQRAADYYGKPMRIVVDAQRGQVISVEALAAPGSIHGGPYGYGGSYAHGAPYARQHYGAMPDDDDFTPAQRPDLKAAPRVGTQHPMPASPAKPAAKSAAIAPNKTPTPRKRPATPPQETAGSVEPIAPAPQAAPAAVAPAATPEKAVEKPTPPVAPLE